MLLIGTGDVLDKGLVSALPAIESIVSAERQARAKLRSTSSGGIKKA